MMKNENNWLDSIKIEQQSLVEETLDLQYQLMAGKFDRNNPTTHQRALEDANYNLNYLFVSLSTDSPILFRTYIQWAKTLFANLGLPSGTLELFFESFKKVLLRRQERHRLDSDTVQRIISAIDEAFAFLEQSAVEQPSEEKYLNPLHEELSQYTGLLIEADRHEAARLVQSLLDKGVPPTTIYKHLFHPFQLKLGELWHQNKITVAQEHYATAATQYIMSLMYDVILNTPKKNRSLLAACVSGELHEMGIRMLCDYLECHGWNTFFLGSNMPDHGVIQMAQDKKPHIIAISCTMTFHIPKVITLIASLRQAGIDTPILVGGYPFNLDSNLWKTTGADGYANDFDQVYSLVEDLTGGLSA